MTQHQVKEPNPLTMNKKLMEILTERDNALRERNDAVTEKREALAARDEALRQRDEALAQRDSAIMERDNAIAALQIRGNAVTFPLGGAQRGSKRAHHSSNPMANMVEAPQNTREMLLITDGFPVTAQETVKSSQIKRKRGKKVVATEASAQRKMKKVGEDLNMQVTPEVKKYKSGWESEDVGLNIVNFDESTMPTPVCSCTGIPHPCYKWGNGGWQSSCCTTTMSMFPLPPMPNKRHARVGGRKMSGNVFARLLSHLAAEGHDLSVPVDLKDFWARHGTNRYITIK